MRNIAIIVAAGTGSRMRAPLPKQYLNMDGEPMLVKTLRVFSESPEIGGIVLVTRGEDIAYCRREIVGKYEIRKVEIITQGGKTRCDSVWAGLCVCPPCDYVLIHDAARPYVTEEIIADAVRTVQRTKACVAAVPSKDTVKIVGKDGLVDKTPDRSGVYLVQTPQTFSYALIKKAYESTRETGWEGFTDDAMVVEKSGLARVAISRGSYANRKLTTPEDLPFYEIGAGSLPPAARKIWEEETCFPGEKAPYTVSQKKAREDGKAGGTTLYDICALLPETEKDYAEGCGETCILSVDTSTKKAYEEARRGSGYCGALTHDSRRVPSLGKGKILPLELRGRELPLVPFAAVKAWIKES